MPKAIKGEPIGEATYQVPVKGRLFVHVSDVGDSWEATTEDLKKFDLGVIWKAEAVISKVMLMAGLDPDNHHSILRYALQRAIREDPLDPGNEEDAEMIEDLRHVTSLFLRGVADSEWEYERG